LKGQHVVLDAAAQALLPLWAVKTCLLLELAVRLMYAGKRLVEGYRAHYPGAGVAAGES
jgi:hypothetical protein